MRNGFHNIEVIKADCELAPDVLVVDKRIMSCMYTLPIGRNSPLIFHIVFTSVICTMVIWSADLFLFAM